MNKKLLILLTFALVGCNEVSSASSQTPSANSQNSSVTISNSSSQSSSSDKVSSSASSQATSSSNKSESSSTTSSSSTKPSSSITSGSSSTSSSSNISSSSSSSSSNSSTSKPGSSITTDLYQATIENNTPDGYYDSCKGLKGEALKAALHEIIDDHQTFNYSSTQPYYKDVDRDPFDSSKMYFIYTGNTNVSTSYNKEHVWAKSHGDFGTSRPAGSDMHNLHPCNSNLNSTRGNKDFAEGGEVLEAYNGNNRTTSSTFEPSDFSKGDTARTIFYMAVRYEGDSNEPDLELSRPSSANLRDFSAGARGTHGNFDQLYKWATSGQDPVDDHEVSRNNKIFSNYQHNRNPFIDHPEFIQMIYDKNYSGRGALLDNNSLSPTFETPEEEVEYLNNLIQQIPSDFANVSNEIDAAINYYNSMSEVAKNMAKDDYNELLKLQKEFNEYKVQIQIDVLINKINNLGEITLDSKKAIEECEAIVATLTEEQLAKVTNLDVLEAARERYNVLYEEYMENAQSQSFEANFDSIEGASGSYKEAECILNEKKFIFSSCYKNSSEFRLGSNKSTKVSEEMKAALSGNSDSSSMLLDFEVAGLRSFNLTFGGKYGTITKLSLLITVDNGKSYTLVETKDFDPSSVSFSIENKPVGKYAFVIEGSTPRLALETISIK